MIPYAVRLRRVDKAPRCLGTSDGTADLSRMTMPLGEHPLSASLDRQVQQEEFYSSSPRPDGTAQLLMHCRSCLSWLR